MTVLGMQPHVRHGANDAIPCVKPTWRLLLDSLTLGHVKLWFNSTHYTGRDFVLQLECMDQGPFVALRPDLAPGRSICELNADAEAGRQLCGRCLPRRIAHKFAPDLLHIYRFPLVGKCRVAGNDEEA